MTKGDIFIAQPKYRTRETAFHPIVFLREHDSDTFIGLMITHGTEQEFKDNLPLNKPEYYIMWDERFSNTYVVGQALIKKNEWKENCKSILGALSKEGLALIEKEIIAKTEPKWWSEYLNG